MKFGRTLSFVLCTAIVPSVAMAEDPTAQADPYAQPQAPATTSTTTVVTPPPAPAPQQPVVVVNPDRAPVRTMVIDRDPETEVVSSWNAPMFATGAIVFAGSYGASAIVASQSDHPGADRLYVPVVGPWLALNDWGDCPIEQPRCDENTTDKVLLVADGVFQAAGVITMVSSLLSPTTRTVQTRRVADTKTRITPTGRGFAVVGRF